ncbi:hypothetical protein INS49_009256 [Diaporthe citri]|uniref:uncharacterized protein n=1 Tax=Diaporthe citri TaxID=83186 RepID=UPI001C815BEC|nr:uncharacterized protein INS49_009256 [Diaporthe citri]KAG6361037.1 hypothetical protein INS49_009256 [Diaporthe citri]
MGLQLHIPPCVSDSAHPLHPPPIEKPLRIQIEGPVVAIQKLLPSITWHTDPLNLVFPQPAGHELAKLAYQALFGRDVRPDVATDVVVRDEYLGWVTDVIPYKTIDYYGVTFDHLVPADDPDPDVLQINIIEMETDDCPFAHGAEYANQYLLFPVDPADYAGEKVLAVPRCCQKRKGSQDRARIDSSVAERGCEMNQMKLGCSGNSESEEEMPLDSPAK